MTSKKDVSYTPLVVGAEPCTGQPMSLEDLPFTSLSTSDDFGRAFNQAWASSDALFDGEFQARGQVHIEADLEVSMNAASALVYADVQNNVNGLTNPQAVANFFLDLAKDSGTTLTPLRLIKLTCIAHGWTLALMGQPLFDERIEAWSFGPVVPSLYHEFKEFRKNPITRYSMEYCFTGDVSIPRLPMMNGELHELLKNVWSFYKRYTASQLVALTHEVGTPWSIARGRKTKEIPNADIKRHYKHLLSRLRE